MTEQQVIEQACKSFSPKIAAAAKELKMNRAKAKNKPRRKRLAGMAKPKNISSKTTEVTA